MRGFGRGNSSNSSSGDSKDEKAAVEAGRRASLFGRVVDTLNEQGHTAAANNVTKNAGRADSPEELADGATRRSQARGRGGDSGQSRG